MGEGVQYREVQKVSIQEKKCWCYHSCLCNFINWDCLVEVSDWWFVMMGKKNNSRELLGKKLRTGKTVLLYVHLCCTHIFNTLWFRSLCLRKDISEFGQCQKRATGLRLQLESDHRISWTLFAMSILVFRKLSITSQSYLILVNTAKRQ